MMGGASSIHGTGEKCFKILVTEPEGKRALGKPKPAWEDNIKMDLKEIGWECVDCRIGAAGRHL
jgi:hypothetical protein